MTGLLLDRWPKAVDGCSTTPTRAHSARRAGFPTLNTIGRHRLKLIPRLRYPSPLSGGARIVRDLGEVIIHFVYE